MELACTLMPQHFTYTNYIIFSFWPNVTASVPQRLSIIFRFNDHLLGWKAESENPESDVWHGFLTLEFYFKIVVGVFKKYIDVL